MNQKPHSTHGCRGLLLLDVDGPLNPWDNKPNRRPDGYSSFRLTRAGQWVTGRDFTRYKGLRVWLNPDHGRQILALAADTGLCPVWTTTWLEDANRTIGPSIGLPTLPVIQFGKEALLDAGCWKYPAVSAYAAGLPLAWFDDEHDHRVAAHEVWPGPTRRNFLAARAAALAEFERDRADTPTLLCQVDPNTGLRDEHYDRVRTWAAALPPVNHQA